MKQWQKSALWFLVGFAAIYAWRSSQAASTKTAKTAAAASNAKDAAFTPSADLFSLGPFYDGGDIIGGIPGVYDVIGENGTVATRVPESGVLDIYSVL
jgi:hypothetical protein